MLHNKQLIKVSTEMVSLPPIVLRATRPVGKYWTHIMQENPADNVLKFTTSPFADGGSVRRPYLQNSRLLSNLRFWTTFILLVL
jgi:hypothetical protein